MRAERKYQSQKWHGNIKMPKMERQILINTYKDPGVNAHGIDVNLVVFSTLRNLDLEAGALLSDNTYAVVGTTPHSTPVLL